MQETLEEFELVATYDWDDIPEGQYFPIYNLNLNPQMLSSKGFVYKSENKSNKTVTEIKVNKPYTYSRFSKLLTQLGLRDPKEVDRYLTEMKKYHAESAERELLAGITKIAQDMVELKGGTVEEWIARLK